MRLSSKPSIASVERIDLNAADRYITHYEASLYADGSPRPITDYSRTLRKLRSAAQAISTQREEIDFAVKFKDSLCELAQRYKLSDNHFSVDTSGDPLLVKEGRGEHLISPTHFENGAYFSHPHADHQLDINAEDLPRIDIGKYVRFGRNASVNAGGNVTIGNGCWLSPGSQLLRQDHDPYGRPSVGSRTVAMTTLPPIKLAEYAWIGREAMVGWGSDYIGKCGIVPTRSFVNSWTGDYAITGDHGRIIQYLPFKAFALEQLALDFNEVIALENWGEINSDWLRHYRNNIEPGLKEEIDCKNILMRSGPVLIIEPTGPADILPFIGRKIDAISESRLECASLLQFCIDRGIHSFRFRGDLKHSELPFVSSEERHFRKITGFSTVVCRTPAAKITDKLIQEIYRVSLPDADIVFSSDAEKCLEIIQASRGLSVLKSFKTNSSEFLLAKRVV